MKKESTIHEVKRKAPRLFDPLLSFDPGPSLKQNRSGELINKGAAEVILEDRADQDREPDAHGRRPVVRGARRRTALLDLYARGVISKRMHDAALRFLDDCSMASGGGLVANLMGVAGGGRRDSLAPAQVDAIGRVRVVSHLLGLNTGTVFWRVVFEDRSLASCDAADHVREGMSCALLKEALWALYEHYNGKDGK